MEDVEAREGTSPSPCPRCGAALPAGADECAACGQPLCPECGAAVGEHWPSCMACGTQFELLCPECEAPVRPRDRVCSKCNALLDGEPDEIPLPAVRAEEPTSPSPLVLDGAPACAVCGRQDETLRVSVFPFVFSLVIVTFRRAFAGLWCRRHRNRYWTLSSLITALAGWFGFPFGFVFTPLALFKLARGGEQLPEQNQHLLQVLAGHKLRAGDAGGAIRCLEEALRLNDDEAACRRVQEQYAHYPTLLQKPARPRAWPIFAAILGAALLGLAIGLLDYAITAALTSLVGEDSNLLLAIFSWAPWVTMLFLGGLALMQMVDWALRRSACRLIALGGAFAVAMALVAFYCTQQGEVMADLLYVLVDEGPAFLLDAGILIVWYALAAGGTEFLLGQVQAGNASGIIYLVIAVVAVVYLVATSLRAARETVRWNQALAAVRAGGQAPRTPVLQRGWLAIAAVLLCVACSLAYFPVQGLLLHAQTGLQLREAMDLIDQGKEEEAIPLLEALQAENPDLAPIHVSLAFAYSHLGELERATDALQSAALLAPDQAPIHAWLALHFYLTDQTDRLEEAQRQAEELGANDSYAQMALGDLHAMMDDLEQAEACYLKATQLAAEDAEPLLRLAYNYARQARYDEALAACDAALALNPDPGSVHLARGYIHVRQEDLDTALAAFVQALEEAPGDAEAHAGLSYVHYLRGEMAGSLREAEAAVALDRYSASAQEQLALACQAAGNLDRALAAAREAVRLNPKDDTSHYALGICYRDLGEVEKASQEFEAFLALYTDRAYVRDWKADAEAYLAENP